MSKLAQWLMDLDEDPAQSTVDGLLTVDGYVAKGRCPEEVSVMEKAAAFGARAVFFEASRNERPPAPQAFIFISAGPDDDPAFGEIHRRLWSWGGVPLIYRRTRGLLQLFRCAHQPDFISESGAMVCRPYSTLKIAAAITTDPWWDVARLRNGTLWDDPSVCKALFSANKSAHKRLINAIRTLNDDLTRQEVLKRHLRRKLLILSLLIAYLEERGAFQDNYFCQFRDGATHFFEVLADGQALVDLLAKLEDRFNGNLFTLKESDREALRSSTQLPRFARMVEGRQEENGQLTLWQLYSFKDLPVELISHIYQLFVSDVDTSVYTPPFVVRLMLDEALSWERLDTLEKKNQVVLDPCCGSGIFLVEAYKRLVLHWRSRHGWKQPNVDVLKSLLMKVHGVDIEAGAIEVAAFSLCLALCDALEPEAIRASIKLFPELAGHTLHQSCFFEAKELGLLRDPIGIVVGNPPFTSKLGTPAAIRSYAAYQKEVGPLPDKQLAYLILHEAMGMVARGGVLSMLQQYNFLYNEQSRPFRRQFISKWDVREILDFVSIRGLFQKGDADTKVLVVVANATKPKSDRQILHATFRRSGRVDAEQGFDIDYYDLHWFSRDLALSNDGIWRANLLGGPRVLTFVDRMRKLRTLREYAESQNWDSGEGFIEGRRGVSRSAKHIIGKPLLPSDALTTSGIDVSAIEKAPRKPIEGPRSEKRFTPPMLLVREHMELPHALWTQHYMTYKNKIVGFAAPKEHLGLLSALDRWMTKESLALRAFSAAVSVRLFTQKATTLSASDIFALPYPEGGDLEISRNEAIIIEDMVNYQRDLIRLGEDAPAMQKCSASALSAFANVFCQQLNGIYKDSPLRALKPQEWPGIICQPFVFGEGEVEWTGVDDLKGRIDSLLRDQMGIALRVTRITRIYDRKFVFMLKPDQLRYWLRSVALYDADETLRELRTQGF